jgi:hypothetical protein
LFFALVISEIKQFDTFFRANGNKLRTILPSERNKPVKFSRLHFGSSFPPVLL